MRVMEDGGTVPAERAERKGSLLLVTMVRLRQGPRGLQLDDQTCAGLVRWTECFEHVVFCGLLSDEDDDTSVTWLDVDDLPNRERMRIVALPLAYKVGAFLREYRAVRAMLADEIRKADKLCFTIGYVFGDWGGVGALEAVRQKRKFAVWFDRVEHDVLYNTLDAMSFRRRLKERLTLPLMRPYHHYLVRKSSLGLFQGMDTFREYAPSASNPACVYDVHTKPEDFIPPEAVRRKITEIENGAPLRIAYVGRAAAMKGPEDWLHAIAGAVRAGVDLKAVWLGDGPLLPRMEALVQELGLTSHVELAGYVSSREKLLDVLRESHVFLFCHKTAESPRCLIEALVCGCPIVGYRAPYPMGLVEGFGGGEFSQMGNADALAAVIVGLDRDRQRLAALVQDAVWCGRRFDEETLYRERAELMATYA